MPRRQPSEQRHSSEALMRALNKLLRAMRENRLVPVKAMARVKAKCAEGDLINRVKTNPKPERGDILKGAQTLFAIALPAFKPCNNAQPYGVEARRQVREPILAARMPA